MNFKTTIFLLVVVGLVSFSLWYVGKPRSVAEVAGETRPTPSEYHPLLDPPLTETDLKSFRLERPGRPALVFERSRGVGDDRPEWRMVEPQSGPVEQFMVSSLVGTFTSLQYRFEFSPDKLSEQEAGLVTPLATVILTDQNDKTRRMTVGGRAALGTETYVRLDDRPAIYAVNRELAPEVRKDVAEYRSKRLLPLNREDITALTLVHTGRTFAFRKDSSGEWIVEQPIQDYVESAKLSTLLSNLTALRAESFVEESPVFSGAADEAYLKISLTTEHRRALPAEPAAESGEQQAEPRYEITTGTHELLVAGFADLSALKRFVRIGEQPGLAIVPNESLDRLIPRLSELRRAIVTRVKAADVTQLELTLGGETAVLRREGNDWTGEGDLAQLELGAVAEVVQAFEQLSAIDFIDQPSDLAKYGLEVPRATLRVTPGPAAPVTLKIGKDTESGRNTYVQREGSETVYVVAAQQAARLLVDPLSLRSREIFSFAPDRLVRVELRRGDTRYTIEKDGAALRLAEPEHAAPEVSALRTIVNDLARLRARRVVSRGDAAAFGLDQPELTVTFDVVSEIAPPADASGDTPLKPTAAGTTHKLFVSRSGSSAFARKDDQPWIFELDDSIYRALTAELIDTLLWSFNSAEVAALSITATGGTLAFERIEGTWKYVPDPYVTVTQKRVIEFLDELGRLRAERYLTYRGADLAAEGFDDAPATLAIRLHDGRTFTLKLMQDEPGQLPRRAAYVEARRTLRLRQGDVEKIMRGLDHYLRPEGGEAGGAAPPGQ